MQLSLATDAMCPPSGAKQQRVTVAMWNPSTPSGVMLPAAHSRTLQSRPPDTRYRPEGAYATERTDLSCPRSVPSVFFRTMSAMKMTP